ncbi:MAG: IPT/TIG domain-containing protein [Candidatus Riflebacteria bacterium]|nr:IPT/TIG domain-containing protein [Candidatus Riflebacteria bacterium]
MSRHRWFLGAFLPVVLSLITGCGCEDTNISSSSSSSTSLVASRATPSSGPLAGGTSLTIDGVNFLGTITVSVGGAAATNVTVNADRNRITCSTPASSTSGEKDLVVTSTTNGKATLTAGFVYSSLAVTSITPGFGPLGGGTAVTITGANFAAGTTAAIGGSALTNVTVVSSTTLTGNTPAGTEGSKDVTVTNQEGTATLTNGFMYAWKPTITKVSPTSGPRAGNTALTIDGTNFIGTITVTVGGQAATSVNVNAARDRLTCNTPASTTNGAMDVVVSSLTNGNATLPGAFTYVGLSLSGISPSIGLTGGSTSVTITGANFVAGTTATIGGNPVNNLTLIDSSTVTCTTPAGTAGAKDVVVSDSVSSATLSQRFRYLAWQELNNGLGNTNIHSLALDPTSPNTITAATWGGGVFRSSDGGASWTESNNGIPGSSRNLSSIIMDPRTQAILYTGPRYGAWGVYKTLNSGATWTPVSNGLVTNWRRPILIHPTDPNTLYVGTAGRGVFKTTTAGVSWFEVNTGLGNVDVWALCIDPNDPQIVYAGTFGSGVYKTTDGGSNWGGVNSGLEYSEVRSLAIDPATPTTLYAGTAGGGVFKTTDGGGLWTAVNTYLTSQDVWALVIDPSTPARVYAGTFGGGVFRSNDGGASWGAVPFAIPIPEGDVLSLTIGAPPNEQTLYAGTSGGGVFRTTDRGDNWSQVNTGLGNLNVQTIKVDPTDANTVYVGTTSGLYKTTDGGTSWNFIMTGVQDWQFWGLTIDPSDVNTVYAAGRGWGGVFKTSDGGTSWTAMSCGLPSLDVQALAVDTVNTTTVYMASYGTGVFRSTDSGAYWVEANNGLSNKNVQALAVDTSNTTVVYAGTEDGGVFRSGNGGANWSAVNTGLLNWTVRALAAGGGSPNAVYAGTPQGVFKTTDQGTSWTQINNGLTSLDVRALLVDPATTSTVYAGTNSSGGLFKSIDEGATWTRCDDMYLGYSNNQPYSSWYYAPVALGISPAAHSTVYMGCSWQGVFRSLTAGQ